jgi:Uma2 family endonuclease
MSTPVATGLTYGDLLGFPEDGLRREIIDGELFVTAAPNLRHQRAVAVLSARFLAYVEEHGGEVFPAPTDVFFTDNTVVEPDVVVVRADHLDRLEERFVRSAPDVVVEVSSPTTRRLDLIRKRALYEREGVPEYWFVDLDADHIDVHRLREGRYGDPTSYGPGEDAVCETLPGFSISVDEVLRVPGSGPPTT